MELDMVMNELSVATPARDVPAAREMMSGFIQTLLAARKKGIQVLRTNAEFNSALLAPDYPLSRWRNDAGVDQVERQYFRVLQTKAPYLVGHPEVEDKNQLYNFLLEESEAHGLGAAFHLEALAVSLRSEERWHFSRIELSVQWLDDSAEIKTKSITVTHASCADHVTEHDEWVAKRRRAAVRSGTDMWNRRSELWPSLIFCEGVAEQMSGLGERDQMLPQVWQRLNCLEGYCQKWQSGPFNRDALDCTASLESLPTLQQFAAERIFRCPDGRERLFEWHVKISLNAWRLHFFPLPEERRIIIGYIGPHLPTVRDPT